MGAAAAARAKAGLALGKGPLLVALETGVVPFALLGAGAVAQWRTLDAQSLDALAGLAPLIERLGYSEVAAG